MGCSVRSTTSSRMAKHWCVWCGTLGGHRLGCNKNYEMSLERDHQADLQALADLRAGIARVMLDLAPGPATDAGVDAPADEG